MPKTKNKVGRPKRKSPPSKVDIELASQLSELMEQARLYSGMTQGELAKKLGVTVSGVCHSIEGRSIPSTLKLKQWARACGLELLISMRPKP